MEGETLYEQLISSICVASDDVQGDGYNGHQDGDVYVSPDATEVASIAAIESAEPRSVMTAPILAKRWGIGLETAKNTLKATTQAGVRKIYAPS